MRDRPLHLHGHVLPGGDQRDIFVADGRLTFSPVDGAESIVTEGYLLPGLVDTHAHLALASPAPAGASVEETIRASARAQLEHGVLAIREPGGPGREAGDVDPAEGLPRVISGGRFLAAPGGYFPGMAREVAPSDLAAAALEEYGASGHWAKIVGDYFDDDGVISPTFEARDIAAAVDAVHAAGGRVAVHAMTSATIERAIAARVDSIEHVTELLPEHALDLAHHAIAIVPTMLIAEPILQTVVGWGSPGRELRRWEQAVGRQAEMVKRAADAGVLVLAGTDAGMVAHGLILKEVGLLVRAGLDGEVALGAASWTAREWLGLAGLEEGGPADVVAYKDDPRVPGRIDRPMVRILDGRIVGS